MINSIRELWAVLTTGREQYKTLDKNLKMADETAVLLPLESFDKEKAYYIERPATADAITNYCEYPEKVFENFILYIHDGGEGQLLFTRGVEGVHYEVTERDENGNVLKAKMLPLSFRPLCRA